MRTRIENGTIVTAESTFPGDLLIDGETIAAIEPPGVLGSAFVDRVVDAAGRYVMPGGVDAHTHLDMPLDDAVSSADDFESGTIAAAVGGTTSIVDYATQTRGGSLAEALETWHAKAAGRAAIDYGFHMIVSDYRPEVADELDAMVAAGVPSFKLFMAYPDRLMLDDGAIFRVLLAARENGGRVCLHAENGHVIEVLVERALAAGRTAPRWHAETRPARAEAEAVHRAAALAEIAGAPVFIVHLSSAEALEEVERAQERGVELAAETCPQYLCLSDERYDAPGFEGARYVMSPPLRDASSQRPLWRGLATGSISTVATDHCPFRLADKARGRDDFSRIPNGAPGIEQRLLLLWNEGVRTGVLTMNRFVEVVATAPARIFGLHPRKGTLAVGGDADLLIWDPERPVTLAAATHSSRVDYEPYEGRELLGGPERVLARGEMVVEGGRFVGRAGAGRFLPRAPRSG
ncbi:MAG: dihydropyrimidinase [Holophagales bacterium]|nr:dihydropyrimidinase [Holophagales bacterium]